IFDTLVKVYENDTEWKIPITINGAVPAKLLGKLIYFYGINDEYSADLPLSFSVPLEGGVETTTVIKVPTITIKKPVSPCGDDDPSDKSILSIFLLGFLGGLIALLTPCVFPMIPVTVSFFTKKSHRKRIAMRNAILYGLFIFLIYVAITLPFHVAKN